MGIIAMKTGIIFDLDGTLWNAVEQITESWNIVGDRRPEVNTHITLEQMMSMMGKTMDKFAVLFPELEGQAVQDVLEECYVYELEYLLEHPGTLYPNVEPVLKELCKHYPLYIVSNCQEGYIETFLKACNLEQYFEDTENYGRTGKEKSENIRILMERNQIAHGIYIGDTLGDYQAAMKAGNTFIHAAYGFGEAPDREYYVNSFEEIPEMIKNISK